MNNKALYKIEAFQIGQTKNGKEMWRLSLTSIEDNKPLTGVIWSEEIPRFDGAKFRVGNVIRFLGQDYNSNYNSVVIKNVTVVKEALLGLPKEFANGYLKEIKDFLTSIEEKYRTDEINPGLSILAKDLLNQVTSKEFIEAPAAIKHHHNYLGGLLKHTYEVWHIIKQLGAVYPIEKFDALQLAAILHDLGKIHEYIPDTKLGTATMNEDWLSRELSHTMWGYKFAHDCGAFDVARMVACHHGRLEWGALFEPETPEEKTLHLADMLSASIGVTTIDKLENIVNAQVEKENAIEKEEEKKEEIDVHPTSSDIL